MYLCMNAALLTGSALLRVMVSLNAAEDRIRKDPGYGTSEKDAGDRPRGECCNRNVLLRILVMSPAPWLGLLILGFMAHHFLSNNDVDGCICPFLSSLLSPPSIPLHDPPRSGQSRQA